MCTDKINYVISEFLTNTVFRSGDNTVSAEYYVCAYVLGPHLRNNRNSVPGIQNETAARARRVHPPPPNRRAVMAQCRGNSQLQLIIIIIL